MAMVYMPHPFLQRDLDSWFRPESQKDKEKALSVLEQLHIVVYKQDANNQRTYELSSGFKRSLRSALQGSGTHRSFGVRAPTSVDKRVSIKFLDEYASKKWENILFYMVGTTVGLQPSRSADSDIGDATRALLNMGEFVAQIHGRVSITRAGFTFVLQDTNAQVWGLLLIYLRNAPRLQMSEVEVLSFLFMLGSLELGQDYSISTLSPTQLKMLEDLAAFGIVYRSSENSPSFYPTRLAVTLTTTSSALSSSNTISNSLTDSSRGGQLKGFIIVETNYRLYAYTSSLLQIAVLSLFTKLTTRFPNLVSGKLTKESITRAVKLGISSSQILSYLTANAHPQMQKQRPFLPPTVMDQIRLWEYEGERVETSDGFLMKDFASDHEYREVSKYAESLGVLVWKNDSKRVFFADRVDQISAFLKKKHHR